MKERFAMMETQKYSRIVVDLRIKYALRGKTYEGQLTHIHPNGCQFDGSAKSEIGDVLFLSFEKGIPLGGFKCKVIGQTFQDSEWKMGLYFVDMTEEEKATLFDRIAYFSFLQDRMKLKMEAQDAGERRERLYSQL